jgi:DNA sulfur modification protein DndE
VVCRAAAFVAASSDPKKIWDAKEFGRICIDGIMTDAEDSYSEAPQVSHMSDTDQTNKFTRRSMIAASTAAVGVVSINLSLPTAAAAARPVRDLIKNAVDAYVYFYPLVVFGVSYEVLTNVVKPTWERLSAPLNQFMSVRHNDPANHGVILPSTDTLYTLAWVDVTKEPIIFGAPDIPNVPGTDRKRFMMYEFMDAWTNVYYSDGLQKGRVDKTNFVIVGPDFKGTIPDIPNGVVVHATANQSWMIVRTQVEGLDDFDNVHAIQDQYSLTPLSMFGKNYTAPDGVFNPDIPSSPGPSPQANALDAEKFFSKAAQWFNRVPFSDADKATGIGEVLAQFGIKRGQDFNYASLPIGKRLALDVAVKSVQKEFSKIAANPASIGPLTHGWVMPNPKIGDYGTDYKFRAAISFVGFGANLRKDGMYPLLVQDSKGKLLNGAKKYTMTFAKGQIPPAGGFWSVTMYQDHFLVPNSARKYSVSNWMNPKIADDGSLTIYMQPTSPGKDLETNWLPSSATATGALTPLMRLYWPLPPALNGEWTPPPAVEVT